MDNRTAAISGSEVLPTSHFNFQQILECPLCKSVPFPPIYQCQLGHNICKNCKQNMKDCQICKAKFMDTRNYVLEDMVLSAHHTCAFREFGCTIVEKGDKIEGHMEICKYKPPKCPLYNFDGCNQLYLNWREIKEHFIKIHPRHTSNQSNVPVKVTKDIQEDTNLQTPTS